MSHYSMTDRELLQNLTPCAGMLAADDIGPHGCLHYPGLMVGHQYFELILRYVRLILLPKYVCLSLNFVYLPCCYLFSSNPMLIKILDLGSLTSKCYQNLKG